MPVDFQQAKELFPLLIGAVGGAWALYQFSIGRKGRLRDEYIFAKQFLLDEKSQLHPFLREKGLQAISGDRKADPSAIEYLLKLPLPAISLADYVQGKKYLTYTSTAKDHKIDFISIFKSKIIRVLYRLVLAVIYVIFYGMAFSPLILFKMENWPTFPIQGAILNAVMFLPISLAALIEGFKFDRATRIVERQ